jgi:hypothetical protein
MLLILLKTLFAGVCLGVFFTIILMPNVAKHDRPSQIMLSAAWLMVALATVADFLPWE